MKPLYYNNGKEITDIQAGNATIAQGYWGDILIYGFEPNETVVEKAVAATVNYTTPVSGIWRFSLVGGGGGGCGQGADGSSYSAASGSSGAAWQALLTLPKGTVIKGVVGDGGPGAGGGDFTGHATAGQASTITINNNLIVTCNGGGYGRTWFRGGSECQPGGTVVQNSISYPHDILLSVTGPTGTNGNSNGKIYTCNPPTNWGNYGRGGRAMGSGSNYKFIGDKGNPGYLKIAFVSMN